MSDIANLIEINETKLKNFEEKLKRYITLSEREIIYINIKNTQEFLISLYKLKSNDKIKELDSHKEYPKKIFDDKANNIEPSTENINKEETDKVKEKRFKNKNLQKKKKVKSAIKRKKQEELLEMNPPPIIIYQIKILLINTIS